MFCVVSATFVITGTVILPYGLHQQYPFCDGYYVLCSTLNRGCFVIKLKLTRCWRVSDAGQYIRGNEICCGSDQQLYHCLILLYEQR